MSKKIKIIEDGKEYEFESIFICGMTGDDRTVSGFVGKVSDLDKALMEREIIYRLQEERENDFKRMEKEGKKRRKR